MNLVFRVFIALASLFLLSSGTEGTDPENEAGETSLNLAEEAEEKQLHRKA